MREILFRGKRVDNGEWVYGSLLNPYRKKPLIAHYENGQEILGYIVEVIPETVGQYTGLKDENDKKIFEHDIVRKTVFALKSQGLSFNKISKILNLDWGCVKQRYEDYVHDNPELLEGENNG